MSRLVFKPASVVPTLAALLMLALLLHLGMWQLQRATQKESMRARQAQRLSMPYQDREELHGSAESLRYTGIHVRGRYLVDRQFLLDNRTHRGRAGYHVITPLQLASDGSVVLVNRGWVPVGQRRSELPTIAVSAGPRTVRGRMDVAVADALLLGASGYDGAGWPRVVQRLEPDRVSALLGRPVLDGVVRLDADQPDGHVRDWPVHWGISPQRHRGYAVQWFALAVTLVIIYLVVNTRRVGVPPDRAP